MTLHCPACTNEMTAYTDDLTKLVLDSCFYCGGLWFDRNELRSFFTSPKLKGKFLFPNCTFRVKIRNAPESRQCCRCENQALTETSVGELVVDECPSCEGIWLDAGEILRLVELHGEGELKGKCQTVGQIKWGAFDQSALGQVARAILMALKLLFKR